MFNLKKKSLKRLDLALLFSLLSLSIYGIIVLFSANSANYSNLISQLLATIIGLIFTFIICTIDINSLKKFTKYTYILSIILLIITLFFATGKEEWGADSWINLGFISFQPAEVTKILIILSIAKYIDNNKANLNNFKTLLKVLVVSLLPVVLILMQPDFGTAMVYLFFVACMLFAAGLSWKWILTLVALLVIIIPIAYFFFDAYQKERILNFLDPSRDISGTGWQQLQGLIAIGSGKLSGRGFLQGTQAQYGYIPEKETDYIFSVLAEEFGFIGSLVMLLLFALMIYRIFTIAKTTKSNFIYLINIGVMAMLFIHIFENVGMTIGLMPVTGIPLPFFSSGGTFQVMNWIAISIILSCSMQKEPLDFSDDKNFLTTFTVAKN